MKPNSLGSRSGLSMPPCITAIGRGPGKEYYQPTTGVGVEVQEGRAPEGPAPAAAGANRRYLHPDLACAVRIPDVGSQFGGRRMDIGKVSWLVLEVEGYSRVVDREVG